MHVVLETNGLYTTQAGVARYIRGLIKGFKVIDAPDFSYEELAWPVENFGYQQPGRALKTAYRELIWPRTVARRTLERQRPDLLHQTVTCLVSPETFRPQIVSIMDFAFLVYPGRFRRWQRWSWKNSLAKLRKADRYISISQFTADEAIRLLGFPASKIDVVYLASDFSFDGGETIPPFQVPSEFLLFVGSLEPGKNLSLLRQVYDLAKARGSSLPPLLIVGGRWEGVATEGPPPADWHYLGRQPDEVLAYLYRRARALLFPSKYEGFGLPLAEAMTLGCPVICSRVGSLPEVGGDAVTYAELTSESYLQATLALLRDSFLRSELVSAGRKQASQFSWSRCANETIQSYARVLATS